MITILSRSGGSAPCGGFLPLLLSLFLLLSVTGAAQTGSPCAPCALPCAPGATDTLMDAYLTDGRVLQNVRSARREMVRIFGGYEQGLRLYFPVGSGCRDTLLRIADVARLEYGGVGATGAPRSVRIYPAREFFRSDSYVPRSPLSFLEVTPFIGYGGSDTSSRAIGFNSVYGGLEFLLAPFGSFFGEDLALAFGGGVLSEGGRLRFPLMGHLRWTFAASPKVRQTADYGPSPCRFGCGGEAPAPAPSGDYFERNSPERKDSTVILVRDMNVTERTFRPFLFVEGGTTLDGDFEGAGTDQAVNRDDHAPYFFGGGVGTPIGKHITLSLGYRRMQLHLLTPCEGCEERTIVNTNRTHSLLLKVGGRIAW